MSTTSSEGPREHAPPPSGKRARRMAAAAVLGLGLAVAAVAAEQAYVPGDVRERPATSRTEILPDRFLRGFDPITVYFVDNVGPGRAPADDPTRFARMEPSWPGAWTWLDAKTLQFRPAEPWPALRRFAVEASGARRVLATMMTAPQAMAPLDGADNLRPFRTLALTFAQPMPLEALKQMLRLEVRDLPGLADSPRVVIERFAIAELPRATERDAASYALTLEDEVPEGKQLVVTLALALGDEGTALWTGRAATRTAFRLVGVGCSQDRINVVGGPHAPREAALDCGSQGELPQLEFSASPRAPTLTALKKLVRLEPAVPDLRASVFGNRIQLEGKVLPDTLYKMTLAAASITDQEGRSLEDPGLTELYFHVGWQRPFLRFKSSDVLLEQRGPRMVPLMGYGEPRADLRIHRVDPLHPGLWPFADAPVVLREEQAPPFPGEEPALPAPGTSVARGDLEKHIRLLGSPLVSRVVDLPLADKGSTTSFGLDIGPLLDEAVGARRAGTYLVGLRRLKGEPTRAWIRAQVTNLSLTTLEERGRAVFFVRTLDTARPVAGARVTIDAQRDPNPDGSPGGMETAVLTTDAEGRAQLDARPAWQRVHRVTVADGDDVLVLDPREAPPRFFGNHWSSGSAWLEHITAPPDPPRSDRALGFVFVERPIYRPGEKVFVKAFARDKRAGVLVAPEALKAGERVTLRVRGPGSREWVLVPTQTPLFGFDAVFDEKEPPTGEYVVELMRGARPLGRRSFKVEAYRIPKFEVQLSSPVAARLDAPFKVKAVARYYAGGSVANEQIRWRVTRRPHHHVPRGREGYLFASSAQFARPEARGKPEVTDKRSTLDDEGADELELNPALDLDGTPRVYRVEATVTGADDQEVSSVTEVRALPPFTLGMKLPRFSKTALALAPEIIAVGVDDKLMAGQRVTVRLSKRTWHSHLRESQFATGQAAYVTEQEDTRIAEVEVVTGVGPVQAKLPTAESGVYVVEIAARDKLGRMQTLSADLYVGGREPVAWQKGTTGVFELVPDREKYAPGDIAHIVLKSPFSRGQAIAIVEQPAGNRTQVFEVTNGQAVLDVPVERAHVPNLPVHVVLMRGRLGESPTDDAPYRPQTVAASMELAVEPVRNLVKVDVKHPESAQPGATVDVTVSLKDDRGAPLGGEVTLWLVDEAVLSLAREGSLDPLSELIVKNSTSTSVVDTRNLSVGRLLEEESPGGDGAEEEDGASRSRRVRKNFQTVPYYQATLAVPASGKLVVPVKLSDDLTNFMVRAVAVSGMERFGRWESKLKVRLPVLVQPKLPRFARQGDRFQGGALARLTEGAEGPGFVKLEMSGPVDARRRSRDVTLSLTKAQSVTFPIEVLASGSVVDLKIRADVARKSDGVGDAFEVTIPVFADRAWEDDVTMARWTPGAQRLPALAEAPRPGTVRQDVTVTSVDGLLSVMAALQVLEEYPHGCLEQKMARLAPQLALGRLAAQLGDGLASSATLRSNVQRLVTELPTYQGDDGLYGYWPGSAGNIQVTAEALAFLAAAEQSGITGDTASRTRAVDGLKRVLRSDHPRFSTGYRLNEQTAALRALAVAGAVDDNVLVDLFRTRREMDLMSRTELALAMARRRSVFERDLGTLRDELWASVVFERDRGTRVFKGVSDPRKTWDSFMLGSPTALIANLLAALVELDPKSPDLPLVLDGLLRRSAAGRGFGSTYDNRRAVEAISAYLAKANLPGTSARVALLDGKGGVRQELSLESTRKIARATLQADDVLAATVSGGPVNARVRRTWLPSTPGDRVGMLKEGFIVQRAMTVIPPDGSASPRQDDQRGAERTVRMGDVVELHTTLTADVERHNVALVVPFAAGLEPMNPALGTASSDAAPSAPDSIQASYVERLDHEVRLYFTSLPRGTHTFHFRLKATVAGSFVHPPPIAELMYDQAVRGRGDGVRLIVLPSSDP